jgi:hypothetical protein
MKITLNKDGATGDNLELLNGLEKRFAELPDVLSKEEIKTEVRTALKGFLKEDGSLAVDIQKLTDLMGEDDKGIRSILKKQGEAIAEIQAKGDGIIKDMSVRSQVAAWMETNKKTIEAIRAGENQTLPQMQIRAAITMTDAASLGSSAYLPRPGVQPGVIDLVRTQPTFWDRLTKGRTNLNPYIWVNKTNKQGNAEFIGEGVLKPLASFELETESSVPKKVAERMKASTELLYDVDGMTSMIENELRFEVMVAANAAVLTGVASSTNPKGVTQYASGYTLTTIDPVATPNNSDAIRAAIAQLQSLNFGANLTAFINPIDAANMDLAKGTEGIYVLPPFTSADGRVIAGVQVIVDNNIAVGYLLIGDMTKYKVLMYQDFFVQWGWENDDFSKNLVTVIGEMRFHQWVSANHAGAFIYDTFANIKTAIAAVV